MSSRINNNKKHTACPHAHKVSTRASAVKTALLSVSSKKRAEINSYFFKTGNGEYGEGDEFIGVRVPEQRDIAKRFVEMHFCEIEKVLNSKKHEFRFTALLILIEKYKKSDGKERKKIKNFYLKNIKSVNNWDLVDLSAPKILGAYYFEFGGEEKLYKMAKSKNIWERRTAIVSTFAFIREEKLKLTTDISEILLCDTHDLIHKATGWMLREVGKKDKKILISFLKKYGTKMPRTMFRYSIECFPEKERKKWLKISKTSSFT